MEDGHFAECVDLLHALLSEELLCLSHLRISFFSSDFLLDYVFFCELPCVISQLFLNRGFRYGQYC